MAIDYTTDTGQVRLLIADTDPDNEIFTDDQLDGYLAIQHGSIKRAAADALDAIATSEALISKVITTQDRSSDGAKVADALRDHANALRKRAKEEEDEAEDWPFFMVFPTGGRDRHEGEEASL